MPDPTRVLVTGGAGLIGSHLADAFVELGYETAILDSLESGAESNLNPKSIFYHVDIRDAVGVERAFAEFRPDVVSHHAAQVSVSASARNPQADADINIVGSLTVLEACRRHGVRHVTFASTGGALYGEPASLPCDEATAIRPLSPYGAAKAAVEGYLWVYQQTWGLPCLALRYANVYGPRQSPHGEAGVVAIFANRMLRGEAPSVFGMGEALRDYVYVGDVVAANLAGVERGLTGTYNVGTGVTTSVNEVASLVAGATAYGGLIKHAPARPGDVERIALDATAFSKETGWRPRIALREGIEHTVAHLRIAG